MNLNLPSFIGKTVTIETQTKGIITGNVSEAWNSGLVVGMDSVYSKNIISITEAGKKEFIFIDDYSREVLEEATCTLEKAELIKSNLQNETGCYVHIEEI